MRSACPQAVFATQRSKWLNVWQARKLGIVSPVQICRMVLAQDDWFTFRLVETFFAEPTS